MILISSHRITNPEVRSSPHSDLQKKKKKMAQGKIWVIILNFVIRTFIVQIEFELYTNLQTEMKRNAGTSGRGIELTINWTTTSQESIYQSKPLLAVMTPFHHGLKSSTLDQHVLQVVQPFHLRESSSSCVLPWSPLSCWLVLWPAQYYVSLAACCFTSLVILLCVSPFRSVFYLLVLRVAFVSSLPCVLWEFLWMSKLVWAPNVKCEHNWSNILVFRYCWHLYAFKIKQNFPNATQTSLISLRCLILLVYFYY